MSRAGVSPDSYTLPIVVKAMCQSFDVKMGIQLHCVGIKNGLESNEFCESGIINMYCKGGEFGNAHKLFEHNRERKLGSWNAIIGGLSQGGRAKEAIDMFWRLMKCGFRPDDVTMHYGCMVDLLGRAGLFEEAREMIEKMPMKANSVVWGCLMGACEMYGDVEMGEWVAMRLLELEPWNDGAYVVLSNIYADKGMWDDVKRVREIMKQRKLAKIPGFSLATNSE
ncbi:E motif [Dillenia turbinata]|uniref:E motif n=1 Tax=Dillenia turbinata TaxID=194707 RepID=A0AAN8VX52_9MAGN